MFMDAVKDVVLSNRMQRTGGMAAFLLCASCSTIFPEFNLYNETPVRILSQAVPVGDISHDFPFSPSRGEIHRSREQPWVVAQNKYYLKGLAGNESNTIWEQLERGITKNSSSESASISGELALKLEIALDNVDSVPGYLQKSLVRAHDDFMKHDVHVNDLRMFNEEQRKLSVTYSELTEALLASIHELRETNAEIKVLEARKGEIQARLPAEQLQLFIIELTEQSKKLHAEVDRLTAKLTDLEFKEQRVRSNYLYTENELRLKRSDQVYFLRDVASDLMTHVPAIGSHWVQWSTYMLGEETSWIYKDDSLGWALASLSENSIKSSYIHETNLDKQMIFSSDEIKKSLSWFYGIYGNNLERSSENCRMHGQDSKDLRARICEYDLSGKACKNAARFDHVDIIGDFRKRGLYVFLDAKKRGFVSFGVIRGKFGEDHFHVSVYESLREFMQNEDRIERRDYSSGKSKVMYVPSRCESLNAAVFHRSLEQKLVEDGSALVVEIEVRGQSIFIPVFSVRMEHIPLLKKDGTYTRPNQPISIEDMASFPRKVFGPRTRSIILTKTTTNITPDGYFSGATSGNFKFMTFLYLLELDIDANVVGGSWYVAPTKAALGFDHQWQHVVRPVGVYFTDQVSVPRVGSIPFLMSQFRN